MTKKKQHGTPWVTVIANVLGAIFMTVAYFFSGSYWYLVAAALLLLAGIGMVYFMRHIRKKFGQD